MFKPSARTQYGLRAIAYLSRRTKVSPLGEIASKEMIPADFLEKILSSLRRAGLVDSKRGSAGGYFLKIPASRITVGQIIEALEGPLVLVSCLDKKNFDCPLLSRCLTKNTWGKIQEKLIETLNSVKLSDLTKER